MKSRLLPPCGEQPPIPGQHCGLSARGLHQRPRQLVAVELAAIDPPRLAGLPDALQVVAVAEQAGEIDAGDAPQGQHQGLSRQEPPYVPRRVRSVEIGQGVEIRDVQLVRQIASVRAAAGADQTAPSADRCDQSLEPLGGNQTFQRPHADAVVRRREIEKRPAGRGGCERGQPADQRLGVLVQPGVQQQRRQAELIHHVRFVAVAEIADVLGMRDVRFGQQQHARGHPRQHFAEELYHGVRLRQVNARCANLLAHISHGVQANDPRPAPHVVQQHLGQFQQYLRLVKVQVHLVGAEGRPDLPRPAAGRKFGQQRQAPRSGHRRQIGGRIDLVKITHVGFVSLEVLLKPAAVLRHMVQDQVEHQVRGLAHIPDVVPVAQRRIDRSVIDHREPVVRRGGKKGQQMDGAEQGTKVLLDEKLAQRVQRPLARCKDVIAIGDQDGVALVPQRSGGNRFGQPCRRQLGEPWRPDFPRRSIDFPQPLPQPSNVRRCPFHDSIPFSLECRLRPVCNSNRTAGLQATRADHKFSIPVMLVMSTRNRRRSTV